MIYFFFFFLDTFFRLEYFTLSLARKNPCLQKENYDFRDYEKNFFFF